MTDTIARIDPFPFQHRVADLMRTDVPVLPPEETLAAAAAAMAQRNISASIVLDATRQPIGIVTERDVLRKVAADGANALQVPLAVVMSKPVASVAADAFFYVAIARMNRLRHRHLAIVEASNGAFVGLLDVRAILHQRASVALAVADQVAQAATPADLAAAFREMPALARSLRQEGVAAHQVAAVLSGVVRDMTSRAGEMAADQMERHDRGSAPASWCLLVLGSGGRGESLLTADQDNALIHDYMEDDHPWFEEFGRRVTGILDQSGVPYCRGGVMASERNLRHNLDGWQRELDEWFVRPEPRALLNADIFYDFTAVSGHAELAGALRGYAMRAKDARLFLNLMAKQIDDKSSALGWFGRFKTRKGRIDLKVGGLFPIVAGARILALRLGSVALSSRDRWRDAFAAGIISDEDLARVLDAHELILGLMLDQQLEDLGHGGPATTQVEVRRLLDLEQDRLKQALHMVGQVDVIVRNALGEAAIRVPQTAPRLDPARRGQPKPRRSRNDGG